jgi:hypothetical protein
VPFPAQAPSSINNTANKQGVNSVGRMGGSSVGHRFDRERERERERERALAPGKGARMLEQIDKP